ncbi:MAG: hypothetical protein V4564_00480 [Pseudomonadota bacterium]
MASNAPTPALNGNSRVQRLVRRVRELGFAATLRKLFADRIMRRSTSVIVEYQAGWSTVGDGAQSPPWLSFVIVRQGEPLPPLNDWLAWRDAGFAAMQAAGKVAIFALDDGIAIGCVWLALADHHDPVAREHYPVREREAYHYCWLVDPADRRRNVALPMCRYMLNNFANLGVDRSFGVVDRVNRPSYLIQLRMGFRERGVKVVHYHLFGWRWTAMSRYDGVLGTVNSKDRKMLRG